MDLVADGWTDVSRRLGGPTVVSGGDVKLAMEIADFEKMNGVRKRVDDINTELTISLFSAYGAFVPAQQLGVSGALAAVTCGVYVGFRAPLRRLDHDRRNCGDLHRGHRKL